MEGAHGAPGRRPLGLGTREWWTFNGAVLSRLHFGIERFAVPDGNRVAAERLIARGLLLRHTGGIWPNWPNGGLLVVSVSPFGWAAHYGERCVGWACERRRAGERSGGQA
ncbi:MAG TPA: hypothetical protein VGE72_30565 [Azospirillum sp.]